MFKRMILLLLACMPMMGVMEAATGTTRSAPPSIKVLLVHDKPGVVLEVKGKYSIYDPLKNSHISTRFIGKRKYIQALRDGLQWGEAFPGIYQILILPESADTTTLVDGIEYKGALYVYDVAGQISVVNAVDIEDYINTLLSAQQKEPLPAEVLASIAIAARTNAYYLSANPKTQYWAVEATQVGYQGHVLTTRNSPLEQAINSSRYMIMSQTDSDQEMVMPFPAFWGLGTKPANPQTVVEAKLSLKDAVAMANKGDHAAQILDKAFPNTTLMLMYTLAPPKLSAER